MLIVKDFQQGVAAVLIVTMAAVITSNAYQPQVDGANQVQYEIY